MKKIIKKFKNKIIIMLKQDQHGDVPSSSVPLQGKGSKPAFALANVLIILTFIAVIIALAAPILSRPSNIDEKNLVKKLDENTFYVANGNAQTFNVGTTITDIDKLFVNKRLTNKVGTTMKVNGNLRVIGDDIRTRIDKNGLSIIKIPRAENDSAITVASPSDGDNKLLLNLSTENVVTGLNIIPSYTPETVTGRFQSGAYFPPRDGYLLIENAIYNNDDINFYINNADSPRNKDFTRMPDSTEGGRPFNTDTAFNIVLDANKQLTTYPILIPIQKGQMHICARTGGTSACRFISLSETFDIDNQTQIYGTTVVP